MKYLVILLMSMGVWGQEDSEALQAMRLGCTRGNSPIGCYHFANMLDRKGKTSEAEEYFQKACKMGHEPACKNEKWDIPKSSEEIASAPIEPDVAAPTPSTAPTPTTEADSEDSIGEPSLSSE